MKMEGLKGLFESKFGLSPENMLFANSLKELIYLIPRVLNPKRVLIAGPAPDLYEDAARSAGSEVLHVNAGEEQGFSFDMARLQKNIENADLVFMANPNRITGKMIPRETIIETISALPAGRPHFVVDESLVEFAASGVNYADIINRGNITMLRTTAYFYGLPGLELAYAVSSAEVIASYKRSRHWEINLLSAEAARTAYKDLTFQKISRQYLQREKSVLVRMLKKIEWIKVYDTDANIILIKVAKDAEEVRQKLRRSGFAIKGCGDKSGAGRSFFRLSVMKHENNLKFISALNSLNQGNQARRDLS